MFFAASNGQVRTRTVRQSARGGGTPCPALIDYRWCGSARNCKAGYFKWWIFNYCIRHTTNCEWVENNNWECLTNGPTWHPIDSEKLRCHWSNYLRLDLLMCLPQPNLGITSMSKWYNVMVYLHVPLLHHSVSIILLLFETPLPNLCYHINFCLM